MEYLRDKAVFLLFDAFLLVAVILLFYLLSVGTMIIVFFGCIFLACMVVPLIVEYRKRKAFYENFIEMLDSLERKNLIAEMVERPDFREGMILYDALKTSNKAMLEEIRKYSKAQKEYQEYIEMWVHEIKTPIASSRLILENSDGFAGADGLGEDLSALENLVEQVLFYARSNACLLYTSRNAAGLLSHNSRSASNAISFCSFSLAAGMGRASMWERNIFTEENVWVK